MKWNWAIIVRWIHRAIFIVSTIWCTHNLVIRNAATAKYHFIQKRISNDKSQNLVIENEQQKKS